MDDRIASFMAIVSGFMLITIITAIVLYVMIASLKDKVEMNSIYLRDIDRDLDNLTEYVNNSKNALLDYFNLEIQKAPFTVIKKGK